MITKFTSRTAIATWCKLLLFNVSCNKGGNSSTNDNLYRNSPSSPAPEQFKGGLWFWGGLGPIAYYDRNGHEVGNGTEAARQYSFTEEAGQSKNRRVEFIKM